MIISKKDEISAIKKKFAESVRQESKDLKNMLEKEANQRISKRELEKKRLEDLEKELNKIKDKQLFTRKSSLTIASNRSREYLDHLNNLHSEAKKLKSGSMIDNFPKPPPLEEASISNINKTIDHIRVPIYVPKSILKKSQKAKPPMFNHVLKSGEVISAYILSDSVPLFDPLIKAEAKIPKSSLGGSSEIVANITYNHENHSPIVKSVSPVKHKQNSFELSPPLNLYTIRESTPKDKIERYVFRDFDNSESTTESTRSWVSERMKNYSKRIRDACKPQISLKKKMQLEMLKEKMKHENKPIFVNRVKLDEIL